MQLPRSLLTRFALPALVLTSLAGSPAVAAVDGTTPSALDSANRSIDAGDPKGAIDLLYIHLAAHPDDRDAKFARAVALSRLGKTDEAIEGFIKLIKEAPQFAEPYNNLAAIYADRGEFGKARAALEIAVARSPGYQVAWANLGDVQLALAQQAYLNAASLNKGDAAIRTRLKLLESIRPLQPAR